MTTLSPNSFGTFLEALGPSDRSETIQDVATSIVSILAARAEGLPLAELHERLSAPLSALMAAIATLQDGRMIRIEDGPAATVSLTLAGEELARIGLRQGIR